MVLWRRYQSTILIYAILLLVLSGMVVPLVWDPAHLLQVTTSM